MVLSPRQVLGGNPFSDTYRPNKLDLVALLEYLMNLSGGYAASYETRAELFADLAHPSGAIGRVLGDSTADFNGVYKKSGGSGGGAWTRIGPLPGADVVALEAATALVTDEVTDARGGADSLAARLTAISVFIAESDATLTASLAAEAEAREILEEQTTSIEMLGIETAERETGLFERLFLKKGVYPVIEQNGDILVAIDRIGRLLAMDVVRPEDQPSVIKNGVMVLHRDPTGNPLLWWDCARQRIRGAGDQEDRAERTGAAHALIAAGPDVLMSIGADGQVMSPASARAPVVSVRPYDDGDGAVQQVVIVDGFTVRRLTASPVDCFSPQVIAPGVVKYARADGRIGLVRFALNAAVAGGALAVGGTAISGHFTFGQSLAGGSSSGAPDSPVIVNEPPSANVLMFNAGMRAGFTLSAPNPASFASLTPAKEVLDGTGLLSDTGNTTLGFNLVKEIRKDVLLSSFGSGGQPYTSLKKGTNPYANFIYAVQQAMDIAAAGGRTFTLDSVNWRQGESDEDKTSATYQGYLAELQADIAADVSAITGQAPLIVLQQINRYDNTTSQLATPGIAQWSTGLAGSNGMILAGPQYVADFVDTFHMAPESYCLMASYVAKAVRRHLYQGRPWKPLHVASATRRGRAIDCVVAGGVIDYGGSIAIDTGRVSDPGKYGVAWSDDSASAAVSSVEVTGRNTLRVILDAVPTGGSKQLGFAFYRTTQTLQGRTTGLRSCIRDNDSEGCPVTGLPLHNYLISHRIGVS